MSTNRIVVILACIMGAGFAVIPRSWGAEAVAGDHWASVPPRCPPLPAVANPAWPRHDLDRFVLAALEAAGIAPNGDADDATLLRRVSFDLTGLPPTHPELLDHLAYRFVEGGFRVKRLIRLLVTSRTYRLAPTARAELAEIDPDNTLLWRMPPRRLGAESLRDAILAVSGQLDTTPPVGSVVAAVGEGPVSQPRRGGDLIAAAPDDPTNRHRSVYLPIIRDDPHEALALFDGADPTLISASRPRTTVPAQRDGRDHNHKAYTMWMAGGGVRGGLAFGKTDDHGAEVVEDAVHVHDWHATILHLLGLDHERLTFRHGGREMRLTDVRGNVVREILA